MGFMDLFVKNKVRKGYNQVQGHISGIVQDTKNPQFSYLRINFGSKDGQKTLVCYNKPIPTYRIKDIKIDSTVLVTYNESNPTDFTINDV